MWGRRGKRGGQLAKQLSLGLLEDAMSRAEQPDAYQPSADEPYTSTIPAQADALHQPPAGDQADLEPADVTVDNSAGPVAGEVTPSQQRQRRGEHSARSTRRRSLG